MEIEDVLYERVPKDLESNLAWRRQIVGYGSSSSDNALAIWIMCKRSILFWVNTFVYGYDPRLAEDGQYPATPFITYPFQDPILLEMSRVLGLRDCGGEKSRDMGFTFMVLLVFLHGWLFKDLQSYLLISRKEQLVDSEDPDSLFWKLDWILDHHPGFLVPNYMRQKLTLNNQDNRSSITGCSTTSDAGVGGRKTAIMLDEFAAVEEGQEMLPRTQHTTRSRFVISTPRGAVGAYYDFIQTVKIKFTAHWSQHPGKSEGLYTVERDERGRNPVVRILDPRYAGMDPAVALLDGSGPWHRYTEEFAFRLDADKANRWGVRSPWYDAECDRAPSMAELAQEVDIDYHGSDYQFFDQRLLDRIITETCCPPYVRGELVYEVVGDELKLKGFEEAPEGRLKLWCHLGSGTLRRPVQDGGVVLGIDVSSGTGASNSTMSALNTVTREKILEYANPHITGWEYACLAVAVAEWLGHAHMIWEAQGPGRPFGRYVSERLAYSNIWFRQNEDSLRRSVSDVPGWYSSRDGKNAMLSEYAGALKSELFLNRSRDSLEEHRFYIRQLKTNAIVHSRSVRTKDPAGAGSNHGDRVIADALCVKASSIAGPSKVAERPKPPFNSIAGRDQRRLAESRSQERWDWS